MKYLYLYIKRGNIYIFILYILFVTIAYIINISINYILGGWSEYIYKWSD